MTIEEQSRISRVLLVAIIVVLFVYGILIFYVPVYVSYLQATTAELSLVQKSILQA